MIGRLHGLLLEKTPPQVLVECHGVGYEVLVPMSTFYHLPSIGEAVVLLTHLQVREDAQQLFGFAHPREREAFRHLIKISGVGPRTALSILSGMSVDDLSLAVSRQESGRFIKVPGVGKKTAERLLLELKGKLRTEGTSLTGISDALSAATETEAALLDIAQALMSLGYSEREAGAAIKALPVAVSVSEGIKLALRALNR